MALQRGQRILRFPDGFLWGTASSSHQCEGGNTANQWHRWEQAGHILTGETSADACNWWQEAERDFALAEQMENNALRLSIEGQQLSAAPPRFNEPPRLGRDRPRRLDHHLVGHGTTVVGVAGRAPGGSDPPWRRKWWW